ncbi:MAG: M28 family metallopeptidase [Bacteroidota bacterium]
MKTVIFVFIFTITTLTSAQNYNYARLIVDTLASTRYAGRGYIDGGLSRAAEFITREFRLHNVNSYGASFHHYFRHPVNTFPGRMELSINKQKLTPGEDFIVDPFSPGITGNYQAVIIEERKIQNRDYLGARLQKSRGKIIVIDRREPLVLPKTEQHNVDDLINMIKYAPNMPHTATIVLTNDKLTWGVATKQSNRPVIIVKAGSLNIIKANNISINIEAKLEKNFKAANIAGYIDGTFSDSVLLITAHYDHLGKMGTETIFPGANDNASGIAMLLSLASYFNENPVDYDVVFFALASEEAGLLGAKEMTENPPFDLSLVKFMINFDLAGTGDKGIKVVNGSVFREEFDRLSLINDSAGLLPSVQIRGEACNSDHCPFYQKGVPCFYIYTLGGIDAYHDIHDRPETLPLTEFEEYFTLVTYFLESFQ